MIAVSNENAVLHAASANQPFRRLFARLYLLRCGIVRARIVVVERDVEIGCAVFQPLSVYGFILGYFVFEVVNDGELRVRIPIVERMSVARGIVRLFRFVVLSHLQSRRRRARVTVVERNGEHCVRNGDLKRRALSAVTYGDRLFYTILTLVVDFGIGFGNLDALVGELFGLRRTVVVSDGNYSVRKIHGVAVYAQALSSLLST